MHQLFQELLSGDRLALAKAITLVESNNSGHRAQADELIRIALQTRKSSLRIGITGAPGVGKSTFINHWGSWLVRERNKKVAVLAIDPSSNSGKGSILGDKTRMDELSMMPGVFIRPTPAAGNLGGIARRTGEAILLCEAAGYDLILVETVGVGQSEYIADRVVDCLLLLLLPNAGDELQGIKRGIMELADLILLNKADITEKALIGRALADVRNAVHLLPAKFEGWSVPVLKNGLNTPTDLSAIWEQVEKFVSFQISSGQYHSKRMRQTESWLTETIKEQLETSFLSGEFWKEALPGALKLLEEGKLSADQLAEQLIASWKKNS